MEKENKYYIINVWNKTLRLTRLVIELDIEGIAAKNCPKCDTLFDPVPTHGTKLKCLCGAEFEFYGACQARPINETLQEIQEVIKTHGNQISQSEYYG